MNRTIIILNVALGIIISSCKETNPLMGTWKFAADQEIDSLQNVIWQDTNVRGLLIYTPNGKMSAQLLWNERRNSILNDSIMKNDGNSVAVGLGINSWTSEQNRLFIDTYDSYFGNYTIDWENNIVTHRINGNLRPEKNLTEYKRRFQLNGDTLYLRSSDSKQKWRVVWTKIN